MSYKNLDSYVYKNHNIHVHLSQMRYAKIARSTRSPVLYLHAGNTGNLLLACTTTYIGLHDQSRDVGIPGMWENTDKLLLACRCHVIRHRRFVSVGNMDNSVESNGFGLVLLILNSSW